MREELQTLTAQTNSQIDKMLKIEANFFYQRKGLYEVILSKIVDLETLRREKNQGADILAQRAA